MDFLWSQTIITQKEKKAVVYSLVGTCKMQGIDAREWMNDVLPKISLYGTEKRDLSELPPHHWAAEKSEA